MQRMGRMKVQQQKAFLETATATAIATATAWQLILDRHRDADR
jgi:hypothetical protein